MAATTLRLAVATLVLAVIALVVGALEKPAVPWVGGLQASPALAGTLPRAGFTRVDVEVDWDLAEPSPNRWDAAYLAQVADEIDTFADHGLGVTLDLGLQYPPRWVFGLPGTTRFVNQYGQAWVCSAASGEDSPNLVFDADVRAAAARYIARVAVALGSFRFDAIRVGGLLSGELRYPPNDFGGHANDLWMFDPAALDQAPDPRWRPGTGTAAQARASLAYYFRSIDRYEAWLLQVVGTAFPSGYLQVLFPGWGIRPGEVAGAVDHGLQGTTTAERGGMIAAGEDWVTQVSLLRRFAGRAVVYTTWLDAPDDTPMGPRAAAAPRVRLYESPVRYLAGLAAPAHLRLAGENTGSGTPSSLALSLSRVRELGLQGMMWISVADLEAGRRGLDLPAFGHAVDVWREGGSAHTFDPEDAAG